VRELRESQPRQRELLRRMWRVSGRALHDMRGTGLHARGSAVTVRGLDEIVIDCTDPPALAHFWAAVFGVEPVVHDDRWAYIDAPGSTTIAFQRVPEPKTGKNRLHLDVRVDDIEAVAERLLGLGAARVGSVRPDALGEFQVMLDPEGNEFSVVCHPEEAASQGTRIFVLADDDEQLDAPAVVMLEMPPGYVLFRHAHICHRFEVVVKGTLHADGRLLRPGDVMTARPGEMYGPHTAGPQGCTTAEVFGSLEGVFRVIANTADRPREFDFRTGDVPPEYSPLL
jgi:catechol 2,3-dioxygenase-like lactoylglutathione lyase family enzyme